MLKAIPSGDFMRVSYTLNRVSCHHFRWCGTDLMRREMKWGSSRWNHVCTVTNTWWVLELNRMRAYKITNIKQCIMGWISSIVSFVFDWCGTLGNNKMKPSIGIRLRYSLTPCPCTLSTRGCTCRDLFAPIQTCYSSFAAVLPDLFSQMTSLCILVLI